MSETTSCTNCGKSNDGVLPAIRRIMGGWCRACMEQTIGPKEYRRIERRMRAIEARMPLYEYDVTTHKVVKIAQYEVREVKYTGYNLYWLNWEGAYVTTPAYRVFPSAKAALKHELREVKYTVNDLSNRRLQLLLKLKDERNKKNEDYA